MELYDEFKKYMETKIGSIPIRMLLTSGIRKCAFRKFNRIKIYAYTFCRTI